VNEIGFSQDSVLQNFATRGAVPAGTDGRTWDTNMANRTKRGGRDDQAKTLMTSLLDEIDDERARRLRTDLGGRRWIVSWARTDDGTWLARVSGPGHPETIERNGLTRVHAIELAVDALGRSLRKP
jgi:hypothetical protein